MLAKNSNSKNASGNSNVAQKFNNNSANSGITGGEICSDVSAFRDYMSSANVGEPNKFPTVSFKSVETIFGSLKKFVAWSWRSPYFYSKKIFLFFGPVLMQTCDKISNRGSAQII